MLQHERQLNPRGSRGATWGPQGIQGNREILQWAGMGNMVWVILGNLAWGGNLGILGKGREMVDVILI